MDFKPKMVIINSRHRKCRRDATSSLLYVLRSNGMWYRAVWHKYDSQSQGFGTVQSDRNITANHRDLVPCSLTEIWQPITGIWFVQSDRNMTANHRDLVPCSLTEIWQPITGIWYRAVWQKYDSQSQGFGSCSLTEKWPPITGIWYRAVWHKYGSQSQGFGMVHSDRNMTANHRDLVPCALT